MALLAALALPVLALGSLQQAAAPQPVGHWWDSIAVPPGDEGLTVLLRVDVVEPLAVNLESTHGDLAVAVETLEGEVLGVDDDGSLLPNALLQWTPPAPGVYRLRATTKSPWTVQAWLCALRGPLDPEPPDRVEHQLAYWHVAYLDGHVGENPEWVARALEELVRLEDLDGPEAFAEKWHPRSFVLRELQPLRGRVGQEADGSWKQMSKDIELMRGAAVETEAAAHRLMRLDPERSDAAIAWALMDFGMAAGWFHDPHLAVACLEHTLACFERAFPSWNADLLFVRHELAAKLGDCGRRIEALEQELEALEGLETIYPHDNEFVWRVLGNIATSRYELGDLDGALAALERQHASIEQGRAPAGADGRTIRWNLAVYLREAGRLEEARELEQRVLAELVEKTDAMDPDAAAYRINLAVGLFAEGRIEEAQDELRSAIAELTGLVGIDDPLTLTAKQQLATVLLHQGREADASSLAREALQGLLATGASHGDVAGARLVLAECLQAAGDHGGVEEQLVAITVAERERLSRCWSLPWSLARSVVAASRERAELTFALRDASSPALDEVRFEWIETARALASSDLGVRERRLSGDPRVAELRKELLLSVDGNVRAVLGGGARRGSKENVAEGAFRRDSIEGRLRALEGSVAGAPPRLGVADIAVALGPGEGVLAWFVVRDEGEPGTPYLHGYLLRHDGQLAVLDPVRASDVDRLVEDYRAAVGVDGAEASVRRTGEALRAVVLDPVLRLSEGLDRLHVCLDGALHLVDLETLPIGVGLVGDRVRLLVRPSLRALVAPDPPAEADASLVVVHSVAYDAAGRDPVLGLEEASVWRGAAATLVPLAGTADEAEAIRTSLRRRHPQATVVSLSGAGATKEAVYRSVGGATHVHFATHAICGIEELDLHGLGPIAMPAVADLASKLSPLTLAGLALTGANEGARSDGRVPGMLTAEELTVLDLAQCELFVASACNTSGGLRGAWTGVQSLRAAAHAAGARRTVTTLWAVRDALATRMMRDFYRRAWIGGSSPSDALWAAKRELWEQREPARAWAGWVLSGDPR